MKSLACLALTLLVVSSSAFAQTEASAPEPTLSKARGTKVGIGLAIAPAGTFILTDNDGLTSFLPMVLRIPVNISSIKLEPEVGIYSITDKSEQSTSMSENTATLFRIGTGIFYNTPVSSDASVYVGPKFGVMQISTTEKRKFSSQFENEERTTESSQTNIFFSAMVGGEYFLSSHFSIGAEAGFEYISKGDEDITETPVDPVPTTETTNSGSEIVTKSALTARFYF